MNIYTIFQKKAVDKYNNNIKRGSIVGDVSRLCINTAEYGIWSWINYHVILLFFLKKKLLN